MGAQGLNKKKKKNNIWGSFIQEESLNAEITGSLGVGKSLKDLDSDRGAETYDYTQIIKERQEEERRKKLEEKEKKGSKLDDDMDSYWSRKDDEVDDSDEDNRDGKDEAMEDTGKEDDSVKRGTKRSVKDRLGEKKMRLDRFKNEVLPPPGQPRQIPDIAEDSLVEGTDEEFGAELAARLQEEEVEMIIDLVKILGRRRVWEFFKETQAVEAKGGMMINNGARRRTAGGVLMHLLRTTEDHETAEKLKHFSEKVKEMKINGEYSMLRARKRKSLKKRWRIFSGGKKKMAAEKEKDAEDEMDDDAEKPEEEEELKPLPNILSMIATSLNKETSKQPT